MDAAFIWNLSKLGRIGSRRLQFDDDFADRLNYQYTSVLLFLFIGLIGVRQYVGKPIQCWIPQEFTRGWEEYAENYCWVANTYFAPVENRLPPVPDRRESLLVYYQWAPIVMAAQALLFYLPCLIWRLGMAHSGFNLHRVLQMAAEANEMLPEATAKTVRILSYYMKSCIQRQRLYKYTNQYKNFGLYNRLENDASNDKELSFHTCPLDNEDKILRNIHSSQFYSTNITCQTDVNTVENSFHTISKVLNGKAISTLKLPNEQIICNESIEHSISSDSSSEILHKGRGRKPPPPPPPKVNNTSVNSMYDQQRPQLEVQNVKSSDNVNISKENKKKSTCKLLTENRKLSQTIKNFGMKDAKLSPYTNFKCNFAWCGKEHGNFLVTLYMLVKLGYLSNVIGQIYLMQYFIGTKYTMYGAQVLIDLIKGQEWHHSGHFPRVTFCDLEAKKLGKNHVYTLQCVLPLNMFLEKIYIFLWFWHVLIAFITFISFIVWLYRIYWPTSRIKFITDYLKVLNLIPINKELKTEIKIQEFVNYYLGLDGLFVIRLITANCGLLLAGELTAELWRSYQNLFIEQITSEPTYICIRKSDLDVEASVQNGKDNSLHESVHCLRGVRQYQVANPTTPTTINPYFWTHSVKSSDNVVNHVHNNAVKHQKIELQTTITNDQMMSSSPIPVISQVSNTKPTHTHRSHCGRLGNSSDDIV
ncbi:Innexin unc-7 [Schistosoma japonicum]|uniref:Innexin n=1 Tax=Schistosoma japonicum TaxID=6182 RepID=A0A4Z2DV38_SCHJA|nr:Innexin unc-7 [Schistosoma japonicum]